MALVAVAGFVAALNGCDDDSEPTAGPPVEAARVLIAKPDSSQRLAAGDTLTLTASLSGPSRPGHAPIAWASSDTAIAELVATPTQDGVPGHAAGLRLKGAGAAVITATSAGAAPDSFSLTVAASGLAAATSGTTISPGQSIQSAVNVYPGGTTFTLKAGVHRMQLIQPKPGDIFIGESGAILSGARLLTSFTRSGSYYVASGQTQQGYAGGVCADRGTACQLPEQLFIDDRLLTRVTSLSQVTSGKWYFDYGADKAYFVDSPSGHRVEISVSSYAFASSSSNVTVKNLIVEKYANSAQMGAFLGTNATGWTLDGNEVRWNHGPGVAVGSGWKVLRNNIHHNGQLGIVAGGGRSNILIDHNEIAYNNTLGFDPFWEAGGGKFMKTSGLTVSNNYVHHNNGSGLWTDTAYPTTVYEYNRVTDNTYGGIYHEVSYDAKIRYNICERNGMAKPGGLRYGGINVDNSPNVEIYGNTLSNNRDGIGGRQVSHGAQPEPYGPLQLKNFYVHDNTVTMSQTGGYNGVIQFMGDNSYYTSKNNKFVKNTYYLSGTAMYFHWLGSPRTDSQWRGYGQDAGSTFNRK
jgi:parallel beta helix pectate lyase-like protein